MKAEHRKELQTNTLADYLGRAIQTLKSGHSATILLGLVVVVVLIWWGWSRFWVSSRASNALLWSKLDGINSDDQLTAFAEANPGTTQGRTAQFELARFHIQRGVERLGNPDHHAEAIKDLTKARQLYQELLPRCRTEPLLQQEALMGIAKAEESLIGVAGSIDKAIGYYQELAGKFPESFQGKAAKERFETLTRDKQAIEKFYVELNQRTSKK